MPISHNSLYLVACWSYRCLAKPMMFAPFVSNLAFMQACRCPVVYRLHLARSHSITRRHSDCTFYRFKHSAESSDAPELVVFRLE